MKKCGIYMILNKVNYKCYIGSSNDIRLRIHRHIKSLNNQTHYNTYLQRSWKKYTGRNFDFIILEECSEIDLILNEQYWMDYYQSINRRFGYNIELANRTVMSEETKQKISESNIGRIFSEETKEKMRKNHADFSGEKHPLYNKKHSPETIELLRKKHRGKKLKSETKMKISMNNIHNKTRVFISPDGEKFIVHGKFREFCKQHNLRNSSMIDVFMKRKDNYKGWIGYFLNEK
jgi:group I intron endonuclease